MNPTRDNDRTGLIGHSRAPPNLSLPFGRGEKLYPTHSKLRRQSQTCRY